MLFRVPVFTHLSSNFGLMVLSRWGTKCYWCRGTFPSCKKKSWSKRRWMSEDFPGYYTKQFRILNASSALVVNCLQWTRCLKFSSTSLLCGKWSWILLHFCSHFFCNVKNNTVKIEPPFFSKIMYAEKVVRISFCPVSFSY